MLLESPSCNSRLSTFSPLTNKPRPLAAIFDVVLVGLCDDGATITGNAADSKLQRVAGFRAAADQEGYLCNSDVTPRAVGRYDLQDGSSEMGTVSGIGGSLAGFSHAQGAEMRGTTEGSELGYPSVSAD